MCRLTSVKVRMFVTASTAYPKSFAVLDYSAASVLSFGWVDPPPGASVMGGSPTPQRQATCLPGRKKKIASVISENETEYRRRSQPHQTKHDIFISIRSGLGLHRFYLSWSIGISTYFQTLEQCYKQV